MFAIPQSSFSANMGGDNGVTVNAQDISNPTVIILFSILIIAILIGFIIKLKFETKTKK